MKLTDRKRLARLMVIKGVSGRTVAAAAGWKSHSYFQRLLRGEVTTCEPEHAVKIAAFLEVAVDDLFLPRVSSESGHPAKSGRKAA